MQRRHFVAAGVAVLSYGGLLMSGCSTTTSSGESAATDMSKRQSIDASVDGTMAKLYTTVQGSRELVGKARGVLVFPSVLQVGFVVGGEYGEGSLRVGGSTVGYYSTVSGSFGLTAGAQSKAIVFLFMTQDALDKFQSAKGWSAGADASVALIKVGANGAIDTTTATAPVEAIVMTNSGLMADVSLSGTKVSKLNI
ncbi:MAG TPA: YSC84-related protein [Paraburkholderia sp.]